MKFLLSLFFLVLLSASSVSAAGPVFQFPQGRLELITSHAYWNPEQQNSLGLHFTMADHWHIYWKNSGDSGAAPKWTWTLKNARITDEHWPLPERISVEGLTNLGYSHESLFIFDLQAEDIKKPIEVVLNLEFLICKVECIPYFTELRREIPFSAQTGPPSDIFSKFTYPSKAPDDFQWNIESRADQKLITKLHLPNSLPIKNLEVFPEDGESFKSSVPALEPQGSNYLLTLDLQDTSRTDFSGSKFLLVTEDGSGKKSGYEISLNKESPPALAMILFWALIGGFILNFMPCVFPVLSIKVLSFLGPDKNTKDLRTSGVAYTVGVIVSFLALGGTLLALRAGGEQIGWGFQLQSPIIAAGIAVLFFWLGLNFLGTFEIGQSLTYLGAAKTSHSLWGSFLTGVLATVVATPCTAPFMGAALGASLTLPAHNTLIVFAGLGFGMALPFLLLAYFPQGLRLLPKPGAWMQTLKEFLAFPLFATVLWLMWVLSYQIDAAALLFVLGLFLLCGFLIWLSHKIKNERCRQATLLVGFILSFALLAAMPQKTVQQASIQQDMWKSFSKEAVTQDLQNGKAVFIDFTAAWCITCQVNKKLVLHTEDIQKAFSDRSVQLYKADWTDKNPLITQALAEYGRNSLPLYVYYAAGTDKAHLLPEVLTKGIVLDLLNKEKEP
ncbi:protein-disulfide reductase DsbD family protein [Bdellovibrio bacteriovorus]|uniref:protein-disulfide reductase DsbD family protein n=1 Tax=Bdellovibrio bacteriovorus TaxID=959 RepID=UPI0021D09EB0|nr:thioredoxin family protein [Bdellovibrio bacteriovorus]UXR65322.1 protein-disulfide reductase DsbD family protein [Bdellovibrio bacteriovorus]